MKIYILTFRLLGLALTISGAFTAAAIYHECRDIPTMIMGLVMFGVGPIVTGVALLIHAPAIVNE